MKTLEAKCAVLLLVSILFSIGLLSPQTVSAAAGPGITTQPVNQTNLLGSSANFTVVASGQTPLFYHWAFNGTNLANNGHISGATNATLNINSVSGSDVGKYQVVVSNSHGSVTSSVVTLTVLFPAAISVQPVDQAVVLSSNASFSVTASGTAPLNFQWQQNGVNLTDGGNVSGSTTPALNLSNVLTNNAGLYQVIVVNNYGAVTSAMASLTVLVPAYLTEQPTNQAVLQSGNVVFSAAADGTAPLNFQWYFNGAPLTDDGRIQGSSSTNLSISNIQTNDAGLYQLVVANSYGSATSVPVSLTLLVPAYFTSQPASQAALVTSNVSFAATADGTAPLNYQWYFNGMPLTDGGNINGSTTTNLSISNVQTNDAGSYQLVAANNYGSATSSLVSLDVWIPVSITTQPGNQNSLPGANATFSVAASGTAPLSFQWQFNGANLDGATNPVLNLSNLQAAQAGFYSVLVSNVAGSLLSSNATLMVNLPPPGVPFIAGFSPVITNPGATVTLIGTNFSSVASSNTVYFGAVQAAVLAASVTNLVVTVPVGATFSPITETVGGLTAYANAPFLPTFLSSGNFTSTSLGPQIVLPAGSGPIKVVIADLDGDGKPDLIVGNDYGSTISLYRNISTNGVLTAASFAPPVTLVTPSGTYSPFGLVAADVDGDGKLDIIVSDYNQSLVSVYRNTCTPGNLSSNGFATRVDFATGAGPQGVEVRDLDGDGKPDLLVANASDGTVSIFRNTSVTGSLTTNSFAPRVDIPTGAGCDHVAVADLDGDGLPDIVTANNGAGTVSVLRNLSTPGNLTASSFAPAVNLPVLSEPVQLAIGDLDGDGKPDIIVACYLPQSDVSVLRNISTVGSLTTNSFAPHVDFALGGRGHTPALADLDGSGKPDLAVVTELNSLLSIFRNVSTPGSFTGSSLAPRIDFATGYNAWGMAIGDLDGDGRPDIVFANSYDNTISIYQNQVPFGGPPGILASPTNQSAVLNTTVQLSGNVVGQVPLAYQWFFNGTNLVDGGRINGSATGSLAISNAQPSDAGNYYFVVTNSLGSATSAVASLTILIPPQFTQQPSNQWVSLNSNALFSAEVNGSAPLGYQWFFNGNRLVDTGHVTGSATTNLAIANVQLPDAGNYTLVVTNSGGMTTSSVAVLSIANPQITSQPKSQSALGGATVTFPVGVTGQPPLAYQWQFNGVNLDGATNNPLVLTNIQVAQSGTYSVVVTNTYGLAASSNVTLTVTAFNITTQPTNAVAWLNGSASFRVNVSGNGPFDYLWLMNGYDFGGPDSNVLVLTNLQPSQFGTYSVVVSNPFGDQTSSNANLFISQVAVWGNYEGETNLPASLTNIVAISAGQLGPMDCLALNSNGMAVTWPSSPPTNVTAALTNLIAISCAGGQGTDLGLRPDDSVVSWYLRPPLPVLGLTNIAAIAADGNVYLALTANGTLKTPPGSVPPPTATNVVAIALRSGHYLALKGNGSIIAWGENNYGQSTVPVGLSNVIAIAAGFYHSLALKSDGTVQGWGYNAYGQAVPPVGLSNVVAIAAGYEHSLALKRDGTVVAWGADFQGQTTVPPGLTNVVAIAAGNYHSMALIGNGPPLTSLPLINPGLQTNTFSVSSPSQSGRVYVLEYRTSLSDSNWNPLPLVPGNGGSLLLADPSATNSQEFYRVQQW